MIDEFTHECLAIRTDRRKATDVIDVLSDLFILRGVPGHIRSDNGPEFVAKAVQEWIAAVGARTAYIALGSPWENGCVESFNARLRDELLDGEIFYTLKEAAAPLQRSAPPCFSGPQAAGTRSVRACPCVAVCTHSIRSDGNAPTGAEVAIKLTLQLDHSVGAGQADV